ncbi:hypothetical protein PVL29_002630 [Vitis rotundifolia]|uniref:Uncharacterized protein n=2 Tax=Vitis rotundifolia TaxID=103349 RepID=A0AA39D864_VITRO|nr:hypothetical protein PVL29_026123 [Vitis rotundifolia]KAJ9691299.1 hypothetical protein PVL29_013470 [Vitis rotundifolia]KAJ9691301.1 hypothetical protein PVL29_013472 [Vitis rotundifolia]KAJ9700859.1 hypothetical protein PVL29_006270 [Vitis rotundifolia]KAJ9707675.1 hypothetical protein PVL29_002630 [Vitis rotundifolia]
MGNQKRKSLDIEEEFVVMNDGNGEDIDPESPPGFSLSEPPISGHRNQRNVARSSMDKGKSKMVATPGKLPVKKTRSVRARTRSNFPTSPATPSEQHAVVQSTVAKAPAPTPVTKSAPPPSRPPQFQFTKAPKKRLATGAREDCSGRKFHEECYYDFKAFAASSLTKFSTELCCRYFLEPFMVPRPFFYPRIIREFYRTMTSRGVYPPSVIYFEIDGRQGMLNSEMVARALDIPFTPPNPTEFQPITRSEAAEMVRIVSQNQSINTHAVLRREIDSKFWFLDHVLRSNVYPCQHAMQRREQILEALFRIISGQWWTPADLFMAALFYFEDKVHLKQLQRAKKYPLFFPRMLGTILEYYGFPTESDKEKKHHCREVYTVSRWQGSVTKTESTLTSASLTTANEHHYVPPPNLILEDFGDGEDTPPRPPAATTPGATSTPQNPDSAAHILASLSSTPNIGPSASDGYVHISAEAFNQLLARLDMIQENQANIQLTQRQLVQRVDELTMAVQQWNSSSEKPASVHDAPPLSVPPTQETNSTTKESTVPPTILTPSEITPSHPSHA